MFAFVSVKNSLLVSLDRDRDRFLYYLVVICVSSSGALFDTKVAALAKWYCRSSKSKI